LNDSWFAAFGSFVSFISEGIKGKRWKSHRNPSEIHSKFLVISQEPLQKSIIE